MTMDNLLLQRLEMVALLTLMVFGAQTSYGDQPYLQCKRITKSKDQESCYLKVTSTVCALLNKDELSICLAVTNNNKPYCLSIE